MSKIKTIIFDIGNVIFPSNWEKFASYLGLDALELQNIMRQDRENYFDLFETSQMSFEDYATYILEKIALEPTQTNLEKFRKALYVIDKPDSLMVSLIQKLKSKGYKLGILSNSFPQMEEKVGQYLNLDDFRPHVYFSHKIKMIKPYQKTFEFLINKLADKPHEILFVDDKYSNTQSAELLGIQTHLFTSSGNFEDYLISKNLM